MHNEFKLEKNNEKKDDYDNEISFFATFFLC
jgi:hypothetical protein